MNIPVLRVKDSNGNIIEIPAIKGDSYKLTSSDKSEIAEMVAENLSTETWTFKLKSGSTVTKTVVLK